MAISLIIPCFQSIGSIQYLYLFLSFYKHSSLHDKISSIVAQTFLSVSISAGLRRQTQTRMSVPLKSESTNAEGILSWIHKTPFYGS